VRLSHETQLSHTRGVVLRKEDLEYLKDFVKKAAAAQAAVEELLRSEGMAKQSPTFRDFNPTGDSRVTEVKTGTDALIGLVRELTEGGGPETKRRASLAVTHYENASMWAVKALFSEDAVKGDDGGIGTGEPPTKEMFGSGSGDSDP
jgi:hypothetical protein